MKFVLIVSWAVATHGEAEKFVFVCNYNHKMRLVAQIFSKYSKDGESAVSVAEGLGRVEKKC